MEASLLLFSLCGSLLLRFSPYGDLFRHCSPYGGAIFIFMGDFLRLHPPPPPYGDFCRRPWLAGCICVFIDVYNLWMGVCACTIACVLTDLSCTVLVPVPVTVESLSDPMYAIVYANVNCNKKFTRNAHVCTKNQYARPAVVNHSTEILLNRSQDILRPKIRCPNDGVPWIAVLLGTLNCIHLEVLETFKSHGKYCQYSVKSNANTSFQQAAVLQAWSKRLGVPMFHDEHVQLSDLKMWDTVNTAFNVSVAEAELAISLWQCTEGLFQCDDRTCLLDVKLCDGAVDCIDRSDETQCHSAVCIYHDLEIFVSGIFVLLYFFISIPDCDSSLQYNCTLSKWLMLQDFTLLILFTEKYIS